ncbi:MAG TPA: hypothetical protein PK280_19040, partial [Planctomycetota bacterium]|nr:hypothetical protein [Planctomycetota bacterium]
MSPRERVIRALQHKPVEVVPYNVGMTFPARRKMAEFYGDPNFETKLGNCLASSPSIRIEYGKRDADGFYVDDYGTRWNRQIDEDIGNPAPCLTPETMDKFRWPDPKAPGRFDGLKKARQKYPDRFLLMSVDFSLFERAWVLAGMEEFMVAMAADRGFAGALLDRILEVNLGMVREGLGQCPEADGVIFGDDFGTQLGLMMGPELWRELMDASLAAADDGADIWPQVAGRATGLLSGHHTTYSLFDAFPAYQEL